MSGGGIPAPTPSPSDASRIARVLRESLGDELVGIVFFGSRYVGTSPNSFSVCDLFLVVERYEAFYRIPVPGIARTARPRLLSFLNRHLPPNIFSYDDGVGPGAKCFVISSDDFARMLRRRSPDHFVKGRLTQSVQLLDARDEASRARCLAQLDEARRSAMDWVPSFFTKTEREQPFDVLDFTWRMLKVSYANEIRPEPEARVREVLDAQRPFLERTYGAILNDAAQSGVLRRDGDRFRLVSPPGGLTRLGWRAYFLRSKVRATLRWLKYTFTFEDWLDYLVRKVERRTGVTVEITPMERRLPFLLLWPKVFYVLRERRREPSPRNAETGGPE